MTATLPPDVQRALARGATLTTIEPDGRPRTFAVTPSYALGAPCIDVPATAATSDPHVALLFSGGEPMVLVQGTADPAGDVMHVRPERVYAWPGGDATSEPALYGTHLEEVRSHHVEEPDVPHAGPEGGPPIWAERLDRLDTAELALVAPDGFPFCVSLPIRPEREQGRLRLLAEPAGAPLQPGLACLGGIHGDLVEDAEGWAVVPHVRA